MYYNFNERFSLTDRRNSVPARVKMAPESDEGKECLSFHPRKWNFSENATLILVVSEINRCGVSLVARQTSEAVVLGSNPASPTMILGRCRIIVSYCKNSLYREGNLHLRPKKNTKKKKRNELIFLYYIIF